MTISRGSSCGIWDNVEERPFEAALWEGHGFSRVASIGTDLRCLQPLKYRVN
jgi:hypothetical protein